jgi:hypothetical protein
VYVAKIKTVSGAISVAGFGVRSFEASRFFYHN